MTDELKVKMQAQDKIQDFVRTYFPENHKIVTGFYGVTTAAVMDFSDDHTVYVEYNADRDGVIIIGSTRGCIAHPVEPYGEHINLFYAPLSEQQQEELSDLLDDFVLAYENHFADQVDEGDEQTALEDEFEQLYGFIKDWQDKACDKMVKIEQSRMRL